MISFDSSRQSQAPIVAEIVARSPPTIEELKQQRKSMLYVRLLSLYPSSITYLKQETNPIEKEGRDPTVPPLPISRPARQSIFGEIGEKLRSLTSPRLRTDDSEKEKEKEKEKRRGSAVIGTTSGVGGGSIGVSGPPKKGAISEVDSISHASLLANSQPFSSSSKNGNDGASLMAKRRRRHTREIEAENENADDEKDANGDEIGANPSSGPPRSRRSRLSSPRSNDLDEDEDPGDSRPPRNDARDDIDGELSDNDQIQNDSLNRDDNEERQSPQEKKRASYARSYSFSKVSFYFSLVFISNSIGFPLF